MKILFIILATLSLKAFAQQQATVEDGKIIYNFNFHNQATGTAPSTAPTVTPVTPAAQPQVAPQQLPPLAPMVEAPASVTKKAEGTWGIEFGHSTRLGNKHNPFHFDPDESSINNQSSSNIGLILTSATKSYLHFGAKILNAEDSADFDNFFPSDFECSGFYVGLGKIRNLSNSWTIDAALDYSLVDDNANLTISSFQLSVGPGYQWNNLHLSLPLYVATNNITSSSRNEWASAYNEEPEINKFEGGIGFNVKYLF